MAFAHIFRKINYLPQYRQKSKDENPRSGGDDAEGYQGRAKQINLASPLSAKDDSQTRVQR